MLRLVVVDATAESRTKIVNQITQFLNSDIPDLALLPRISVQPLTIQELKFHTAPDICLVGDGLLSSDLKEIANIRKLLPETPLIARLTQNIENLETIEYLARMGVDDTISDRIHAQEFFRKVILLVRRKVKTKAGQLIVVDSGKGGLGTTSIVSGLAGAILEDYKLNKKVAVLDFDFETQDLSRFLQARPFLNENLQLLFDRTRPVTEESVRQCLVPVWGEADGLFCMPPSYETEELYDSRSYYPRILISILETLDCMFDVVIVDTGSARGAFLKTLYRVADKVVFITNNNPSSLYACVDRLSKVKGMMAPGAELVVLNNAPNKHGLPAVLVKNEFSTAAKIELDAWLDFDLPDCKQANRWPGSGETLFSHSSPKVAECLRGILYRLGLAVKSEVSTSSSSRFSFLKNRGAKPIEAPVAQVKSTVPLELEPPPNQKVQPKLLTIGESAFKANLSKPLTRSVFAADMDGIFRKPEFLNQETQSKQDSKLVQLSEVKSESKVQAEDLQHLFSKAKVV